MIVKATADGVTFELTVVENGVHYEIQNARLGEVAYTLSVQQILTRRFLEDQALRALLGNQALTEIHQPAQLKIVEA